MNPDLGTTPLGGAARPLTSDLGTTPLGGAARPLGAAGALRAAAADFYHQSWRLAILNTALGALLLVVAYSVLFASALYALAALLVLVLVGGPLAVSLMYAAVTLAQTEELMLRDALVVGLRAHSRRGLALAALAGAVALLGVTAIRFYSSRAWPLAVIVGDLLALFAITQISLWPRAVFERERPLHRVAGDALIDLFRRPVASTGLALALVLVNVLGIVAGVMPFLTLTIAYSFLAAAHFSLPGNPLRGPAVES